MKLKNLVFLIAMLPFASIALAQTHMGVPPEDFVTLEAHCSVVDDIGNCTNINPLSRTYPDGSGGTVAFTIPEGKLLVVTDVDWHWVSDNDIDVARVGQQIGFNVYRKNLSNSSLSNLPFSSSAMVEKDASFCFKCDKPIIVRAGADTQMTSGFIVTSDSKLEYYLGVGLLGSGTLHVVVRGYLLPDRR